MKVTPRRAVRVATILAGLSITFGGPALMTPLPAWGSSKAVKKATKTTKAAKKAGKVADAEPAAEDSTSGTNEAPKSREFLFTYQASVQGLEPGQIAHIWMPVPPTNEDQTVALVAHDLPGRSSLAAEPKYGNHVLFVEASAGEDGVATASATYRVKRWEVKGDRPGGGAADGTSAHGTGAHGDTAQLEVFLQPDAKVPVDGKPLELLQDVELPEDPMAKARALYDVVEGHMVYSKDKPGWGTGDAEWACESGFGNCTDFHSLFISLARSQQMPAKFEIGFSIPTDPAGAGEVAGYHCWAKFVPTPGGGWVPVDISEADKHPEMKEYYFGNLTADRVTFSTGRDITLVPEQAGPPLNFFIYPYVEVDGRPLPAERVKRAFSYEDVAVAPAAEAAMAQ